LIILKSFDIVILMMTTIMLYYSIKNLLKI
jgi:hypothetical protein